MFISVGIDQRLKLWSVDQDRQALELKTTFLVDIRDILSMDMLLCDQQQEFVIVIVGAGVQTIRFDPTKRSFRS